LPAAFFGSPARNGPDFHREPIKKNPMSDFKFNCPACGQKISCDTGYTGTQIACPACQKTLTVPAASGTAAAAPMTAATAAPPAAATTAATAALPPRAPANPAARPQPGYRPLPQVPGELAKSSAARPGEVTNIDPGYCPQAIASLICSVVFAIGCIPGIILGHVAKARIRRDPLLDGNGMATAGLVISYTMLVLILGTTVGFSMFVKGLKPVQVVRETPEALAILQARVVDEVSPGVPQSENAHGLQFHISNNGPYGTNHFRDAYQGGFFSYTMKVLPDRAMSVNCRYWGNDTSRRNFDIVVDNQIIGTQKIDFNVPGHYFDVEYKIPAGLTKGKTQVTVEIAAHPGMVAGGVFAVQTLKR
jgi:hypothetical protein